MFKSIKNNKIFLFSLILAFIFWVIESLLHALFFDKEMHFEIIPNEVNELWMRVIIVILILLIGFFVERYVNLQKKIQEEKLRTLEASIVSINEVAGNTLSLMSHYCADFIKAGEADLNTIKSMKEIIDETFISLNHISELKNMIEREQYQKHVRDTEIAQSK